MPESGLTIAVWDAESGAYVSVDCQLDTEANKITPSLSHFSRYTIIATPGTTAAPAPASTAAATSPEVKPAVTSSTTTSVLFLPPASVTSTPVAALPVEKTGRSWWLYGGIIIGAVVIIGLLLFVYITHRRD